MVDNVYKTLEITGSSRNSIEEAVQTAIARTHESVHNLRWFEVSDIRGHVDGGAVDYWQVSIKLGLTIDPSQ